MFPSLSVKDARMVIGKFAAWRTFRQYSTSFFVPAGGKARLAQNDTPMPLAIAIQANASTTSGLAPQKDPTSNLIFSEVKGATDGKGTLVVLQPGQELWITSLIADTFRVWEIRV